MIWNTSEISALHLSRATAILFVDCCQLSFPWPYMIVSMIWNTSEISALHLSRATAILVVDCCQFGPSWSFGLNLFLVVCAGLVGVITEQICLIPELIWYYQWYETLAKLSPSHLSRATAIFVVDCCQFGPSWIFGLKMELMACAGLIGGAMEQSWFFPCLIC